ncbi:MAG: D-alanyl-D-alanine carboxypeptidase/D-alanyl-D-alanine-endopeptidase [Cellulomonas sp.]|uniref:D-alanyl-D-alanine carboxypeptidase/D-alanyl-D-alanine endopeptidase n=1 Tax=Cellulomonas sp. 73-92 TaxID=1895740 RepID=UPI000926D7CF|nr:D-alanyl-D-alanine carboxypeptidase/D-alanyl-D-alanine-endopeptidase [Cellulomonas sp. 73-92]MBN9375993.1 D-alanyl-D-alanine carboxypeptidase/D-alanyl-D-alanine-endopeptidase [Cellulomonas sp.]OJV81272.1 MAG: D-alanyl-D-alanine carboxypeptidase/D-alanyl-D-alanine-endopeptidase [Cellulomonas sp. 73-92]
MGRAGKVVGTGLLVVVLAAGAYVVADAYDLVPGGLTLAAPPPPALPFPAAPGVAAARAAAAPVLTEPDPNAPMPAAGVLQARVDALVANAALGPTTGVVVADRLSGEVLATHLPDEARVPASTAKLLTATAALGTLDPRGTLPTTVLAGGSADELVLRGGGDMMLAAGAGDPAAVVGHAGMADLADQVAKDLKLRGTTTVRLRVDDTLFSGPGLAPGWTASEVNLGYVAPIASIAVNIAKTKDGEYVPRFTDPAMNAGKVFAQRLAEAGITVSGSPTRGTAPSGARVLGQVDSAPLGDVVRYALTTSDNTIAEVLGRLVAVGQGLPASFGGATQGVLHALGTLGIETAGDHLSDCSGLDAGSGITPRTLVGVVLASQDPKRPALRDIAAGVPIAGLTGTLSDRFIGTPASGEVRAKTGSLPSVTSLAGTLTTADGRQLAFAVMADATGAIGQEPPRRVIDPFIEGLVGCGCR